ncbi:hypothetical protein [Bacillus sp. FJAT-22090]|uniref:hypothetical protein n=1 Tax=Bacillus sp. FJAT-22090 TaxID=1581038 RepID=UPI00164293A4|nr:hypothetical protein [Bacillus sp. FJAT-22090]
MIEFTLDHATIVYWSVPVIMESHKSKLYESTVTFETLEKAEKLKVGDEFLR